MEKLDGCRPSYYGKRYVMLDVRMVVDHLIFILPINSTLCEGLGICFGFFYHNSTLYEGLLSIPGTFSTTTII